MQITRSLQDVSGEQRNTHALSAEEDSSSDDSSDPYPSSSSSATMFSDHSLVDLGGSADASGESLVDELL